MDALAVGAHWILTIAALQACAALAVGLTLLVVRAVRGEPRDASDASDVERGARASG
jgi:hypothetical protein